MTETKIDLPGVIAKSDDADFLRELIQDAAQRFPLAVRFLIPSPVLFVIGIASL